MTTEVELELQREAGIIGTIYFEGEPLPGAAVTLRADAGTFEQTVRTRAPGVFMMFDAPVGDYDLTVRSPARPIPACRRVRVKANELTPVKFDIGCVPLTGRVLRQGSPVRGVIIYAEWLGLESDLSTGKTDTDGRYALEVPAGEKIILTVKSAGDHATLIEIPAGETGLSHDVVLPGV